MTLFRIPPELPASAFRTYGFAAPLATHWRPGTCEEVACPDFMSGWRTIVPADSDQAAYIRSASGRRFTETHQDGGLAEFTFEPGQRCFRASSHRIRSDQPPRYYIRSGDWRGGPQPTEVAAGQWQEQFAEHQDGIAQARERG